MRYPDPRLIRVQGPALIEVAVDSKDTILNIPGQLYEYDGDGTEDLVWLEFNFDRATGTR